MDYQEVKIRIKKHEGFQAEVYYDSLGRATIGYGHLLTANDDFVEGIQYDKAALENLFDRDFNKAKQGMEELVGKSALPIIVKGVIIEMVFQLGKTGVSKFKNMFAALNEYDYIKAAAEMINSAWYKQTPNRCKELANLVTKCEI
jgi:GH24 family phage-related lysozyme (muramidase)